MVYLSAAGLPMLSWKKEISSSNTAFDIEMKIENKF